MHLPCPWALRYGNRLNLSTVASNLAKGKGLQSYIYVPQNSGKYKTIKQTNTQMIFYVLFQEAKLPPPLQVL